jgi:hypothetical protein
MSNLEQFNSGHHEQDLWEFEARQRSSQLFQQVFQIYAVIGALVGIFSSAYYFVRKLQIDLSSEDRLILLVAGSGFAISIVSFAYLFLRRQTTRSRLTRARHVNSASDFLAQWLRFEEMGKRNLEAAGTVFNRASIRDIVAGLLGAGILKEPDLALVEEALRFRNTLVHGSNVDLEFLTRMTGAVRDLADRVGAANTDAPYTYTTLAQP